MENETITESTDETVVDEEMDFGPFAVAAVALLGVGTAGVVIGRNYERVRDNVRTRLAVRRERRAQEAELVAIESNSEDE